MAHEVNIFCKHTEDHHIHLCSLSVEGRKQMVARPVISVVNVDRKLAWQKTAVIRFNCLS